MDNIFNIVEGLSVIIFALLMHTIKILSEHFAITNAKT